ncbi:hypothetical protein CFAM422_007150 [Trichoderma lentiforme]|uniref:Uncharacterized protein n=1 Tax=Trichoderma lentiforme TaxID=1567552 RepID=A0A9P4XDJ3_9HYPO|nr:hypothetical protein CFAM422_007150 [Trichoderma lentiforme]
MPGGFARPFSSPFETTLIPSSLSQFAFRSPLSALRTAPAESFCCAANAFVRQVDQSWQSSAELWRLNRLRDQEHPGKQSTSRHRSSAAPKTKGAHETPPPTAPFFPQSNFTTILLQVDLALLSLFFSLN